METPILQVTKRNTGIKPRFVRKSGKIPGIAYGRGKETTALMMEYQTFRKIFEKAGESSIIELDLDGKKMPALVHEVQFDPVSDAITHVDFYLVDMKKEVTAKIPLRAVGVSPAVKNMGGILTLHKHELTVKCLPKDLIPDIEVDVSVLADFHSSIHVRDLKVPETLKVLDNLEDAIANTRPPKIEEEKPAEAAVPVEGAAPVEGAVAPEGGAAGAAAAPEKSEKKSDKK